MPLPRWISRHLGRIRGTRRSVTRQPAIEPLEGRAMLSHAPMPGAIMPAAIHAEGAVRGVFPPPNDPFWQPLRDPDGSVLLPGPAIVRAVDVPHLVQDTRLAETITPPKGVTYVYFGNNNVALYELEGSPQWHVIHEKSGRLFVRFDTFQGETVPIVLPGTVVRVVKNWTPRSHDPEGNKLIVRTVFPNGSVVFTKYEHLRSNIMVKVGDKVNTMDMIAEVGRTGAFPPTGPTNLTIVCWTPRGGGRYLQPIGTPHYQVTPDGHIVAVLPTTQGCSPNFIDTDQGVSPDDPDMDDDDPGGVCN